jgi:hypothetical protein
MTEITIDYKNEKIPLTLNLQEGEDIKFFDNNSQRGWWIKTPHTHGKYNINPESRFSREELNEVLENVKNMKSKELLKIIQNIDRNKVRCYDCGNLRRDYETTQHSCTELSGIFSFSTFKQQEEVKQIRRCILFEINKRKFNN